MSLKPLFVFKPEPFAHGFCPFALLNTIFFEFTDFVRLFFFVSSFFLLFNFLIAIDFAMHSNQADLSFLI
jgi:hypothetical protein